MSGKPVLVRHIALPAPGRPASRPCWQAPAERRGPSVRSAIGEPRNVAGRIPFPASRRYQEPGAADLQLAAGSARAGSDSSACRS